MGSSASTSSTTTSISPRRARSESRLRCTSNSCGWGFSHPRIAFDSEAFITRELAELESRNDDWLEVDRWVGFSFDRALIADRDLWKFDRMVKDLDQRIARDPRDFRALVYRGNAAAFEIDGADRAERHYRAALAMRDDPAVQADLEQLLGTRAR